MGWDTLLFDDLAVRLICKRIQLKMLAPNPGWAIGRWSRRPNLLGRLAMGPVLKVDRRPLPLGLVHRSAQRIQARHGREIAAKSGLRFLGPVSDPLALLTLLDVPELRVRRLR